ASASAHAQKPPVVDEALNLIRQAGELLAKGKAAEAVPLAEKALAIRLRTNGPDAGETIGAMNRLVEVYEKSGQAAEAVPILEKMLAHAEKGTASDRDATVEFAEEALAAGCLEAGDAARAVKIYEQALALRVKRVGGPDKEDVAMGHGFLGNALAKKGDVD